MLRLIAFTAGFMLLLIAGVLAAVRQQTAEPAIIAFVSTWRGTEDIYLMTADGVLLRRLTTEGENYSPSWSPDGEHLTFASTRASVNNIYRINHRGEDERPLTGFYREVQNPLWSPDGERVAFSDNETIYWTDANGGRIESPATYNNERVIGPAWSSDGSWLTLTIRFRQGETEVFMLDTETNNRWRLTRDDCADSSPRWLRGREQIVFVSTCEDRNRDIYRVDIETLTRTRLTTHPEPEWLPVPDPSGEWIAFLARRDGAYHLYRMQASGQDVQRIGRAPAVITPPVWSPDGVWLLYVGEDANEQRRIYRVHRDGHSHTLLTPRPGEHFDPAWRPVPLEKSGSPLLWGIIAGCVMLLLPLLKIKRNRM